MIHIGLAPLTQGLEGNVERDSPWGQRIDDLGRDLLMHGALDDIVALQLSELLDQHLLADAVDLPPQLAEPPRSLVEGPQQ